MHNTRARRQPRFSSTALAAATVVALALLASCQRGGSLVDQRPPLKHVAATTHGAGARTLPPGCQSQRAVEGARTICAGDGTAAGVAVRWTRDTTTLGARYASTSTLSADGQVVLTIEEISVARGQGKLPDLTITRTYGAKVHGIQRAGLAISDGQVTGQVDGRAIIPFQFPTKRGPIALSFADGRPAPAADLDPALANALQGLSRDPTATISSAFGVPSPGVGDPGSSFQNDLVDDETPHCEACYRGCAKSVIDWFVPGAAELCLASCYIPIEGDCAEKFCSGFATCDSNQTCCGEVCCGPSDVCGNDAQGACCPKDFPVGCGDQTAVVCYPAGSTCCGFTDACEAGTVCQAIPGAPPSAPARCCANDRTCDADCCAGDQSCHRTASGKGVCCAHELCGDQCCDGTCVAGQCCPTEGTAASTACGNACCGPFDRCIDPARSVCCTPLKSCGTECCGDAESCVGGSCCPQDRACGTTCCGPGLMCQDPARSICGPIAVACHEGESACFPRGEDNARGAPPICCPTGSACCAGPPATCCAAGASGDCHSAAREPPACRLPICASGKPNSFCSSNADCPGSFCPTVDAVTCRSECIQ